MHTAVAAALAVIDADGPDAVSIRRLARELNYSRSGVAYRIGSMPDLETEVFVAIASDVGQALVGPTPFRPADCDWQRAAASRVLDWADHYPQRAAFLTSTRLAEDARGPVVESVLYNVLGPDHGIAFAPVDYVVSAFALTLEIARLFDDRDVALDAVSAHCAGTWQTLVRAARRPVSA